MIVHAKDESISRTNFESFPEGISLMDIVSHFKQHLEDIVEALESYRERSEMFKETGETTKSLQGELQGAFTRIQNLEFENERLKFELNEKIHESSEEINYEKTEDMNAVKQEVEKLKKLTLEQRDIINNYEELLKEEKKDKRNFKNQLSETSECMKKKLKEKNKRFKALQADLMKLQKDFMKIKEDRDDLVGLVNRYKGQLSHRKAEMKEVSEERNDLKQRLMDIEDELNKMTERYIHKEGRLDNLNFKVSEQEDIIYAYERELSRLRNKMDNEMRHKSSYLEPKYQDSPGSNTNYDTRSWSFAAMQDKRNRVFTSSIKSNLVEDLGKRVSKLEKTFVDKAHRTREKRYPSNPRNVSRVDTKKNEYYRNCSRDKENTRHYSNLDTPSCNNIMKNFRNEIKKFDRKINKVKNFIDKTN